MERKNQFTSETAREMQARGVVKRRENKERRKALRELLLDELTKPIKDGSEVTKLEWLIAKAIDNTRNDVNLSNLQQLQDLLGEKQVNNIVNITAHRSAEDCARDILDEIGE